MTRLGHAPRAVGVNAKAGGANDIAHRVHPFDVEVEPATHLEVEGVIAPRHSGVRLGHEVLHVVTAQVPEVTE